MDSSQPIKYNIPIVRFEIRVTQDLTGNDAWANLIAIDDKGNEHTFGYTDFEGEDHRIYIESPKDGKIKSNPKYND